MPNVRLYDGGRIVRRVPISGVQIVEYHERPGEYYFIGGDPAPEDLAQQARFDVVAGRKEKRRRELMAEAQEKIDEQIAKEEKAVERKVAKEEAEREAAPEVAAEEVHVQPGTDLKAEHRGGGRYRVVDATGRVVQDGLRKAEADAFISDAAAAEEEEAAGG
jgi:hypothetical protein